MSFLKTLESKFAAALALLSFIVYAYTSCPSIDVIDAGELSTVAYTLGIAHPTGYAMFTLLAGILSHIPLPLRVIQVTNLTAGLFCAVSVYFFFRFLVFALREFSLGANEKLQVPEGKKNSDFELRNVLVPAAGGTLLLAFSETFWAQATSVEVYSLHVAFLSILLLTFSRAMSLEAKGRRGTREWMLFGLVLGLSFTNHMTTILLAPAFLFAFFYRFRFGAETWKRLALVVPFFIIGLSAYLYLPVRAATQPVMNWGNPVSLERALWHFTGKQYRVWLFSSTESAARQLEYFIQTLPSVFFYFPLVLSGLGIWKLIRERRMVLSFTMLMFFGCVLYSINYDIHDIDSYFLLAYFTVAIWAAFGIADLAQRVKLDTKSFAAGAVLLCLVPLVGNYRAETERDFNLVEQYSNDMFRSLEPNAIIISYQWDYFVSAANYLQMVEHVRPDVIVVDKELLRRSWYYNQLETRYPRLVAESRTEIDAFLKELYKFEHDQPYDAKVIEFRYASVLRSIIYRNIDAHPIYITPEIEKQYLRDLNLLPAGLAFRIEKEPGRKNFIAPQFHFTIPEKSSKYSEGIFEMYARATYNAALYKNILGQKDSALVLVNRALELNPGMQDAVAFKEQLSR